MTCNSDNYPRISAALIDMDGTLYNSMPNHARAWKLLMDEAGIPAREEEFYLYEGATGAATIDRLILRTWGRHATEAEKRDMYARKAELFVQQPPVQIMPGARELVEALHRRNILTVLVSGSGQNSLLSRLDVDFPGAFPVERRVTSASVAHGKPAPDPFLRGLELAGVSADQAIAIDNAPLGTTSAVAADILTVGVLTGPIPAAEVINTGVHILYHSMEECATILPRLLDRINKPLPVLS